MIDQVVVTVAGRAGAGKDAFADYLCAALGARGISAAKFAYAFHLKRIVGEVFNVSAARLRDDKGAPVPGAASPFRPGEVATVRELLQFVGTECVRRVDPDAWVRLLCRDVARSGATAAVVADARFPNEVDPRPHFRDGMRRRAVSVLIRRPSADASPAGHASEDVARLPPPDHAVDNCAGLLELRCAAEHVAEDVVRGLSYP